MLSGFRSSRLTIERIAVVAAMPILSAVTAVIVKPGLLKYMRIACLASVKKAFIAAPFWWAIESSKSLRVYRNPCRSPYCEPGLDPRGGCHS